MPNLEDHLHPDLITKIHKVLAAMEALGFPMKIVQGARTTAQQQALYAQGRTAPGHIVTNADGVVHKSNHQIDSVTGYGYAVDCAAQGLEPFSENFPWTVYGACVRVVGLNWGGDFTSIKDRPHAELKRG